MGDRTSENPSPLPPGRRTGRGAESLIPHLRTARQARPRPPPRLAPTQDTKLSDRKEQSR
jgi:hypothetical protein